MKEPEERTPEAARGALAARRTFVVPYLGLVAAGSLVWEFAQMPLYTVWERGSASEIIYDGLHCTAGDVLIAAAALITVIALVGGSSWPNERRPRVAVAAVAVGVAYTAFSEWLNVHVRQSWAYSGLMPLIPGTDIGFSPILQWLVVPSIAFVVAGRRLRAEHESKRVFSS